MKIPWTTTASCLAQGSILESHPKFLHFLKLRPFLARKQSFQGTSPSVPYPNSSKRQKQWKSKVSSSELIKASKAPWMVPSRTPYAYWEWQGENKANSWRTTTSGIQSSSEINANISRACLPITFVQKKGQMAAKTGFLLFSSLLFLKVHLYLLINIISYK